MKIEQLRDAGRVRPSMVTVQRCRNFDCSTIFERIYWNDVIQTDMLTSNLQRDGKGLWLL